MIPEKPVGKFGFVVYPYHKTNHPNGLDQELLSSLKSTQRQSMLLK